MKPAKLTKLPPDLQLLVKRFPLVTRADVDRVNRGDAEFASEMYCARACEGETGDAYWKVYFAFEALIGRTFEESVSLLMPEHLQKLARWAFREGRDDVAIAAYRFFLETSEPGSSLPAEDELFARRVGETAGPHAEAEAQDLIRRKR